jgi:acetyl esterase/lipase
LGFLERIDPELREGLAVYEALGFAEQELRGDRITALRARAAELLAETFADMPTGDGAVREDRTVPGPAGTLPVRFYRLAEPEGTLPCMVWIHGGGMIFGNLDQDDLVCDTYATRVEALRRALHPRQLVA